MNDQRTLVERLRNMAVLTRKSARYETPPPEAEWLDAAALSIEQSEAELNHWRDEAGNMHDMISRAERAEARIAELTEELNEEKNDGIQDSEYIKSLRSALAASEARLAELEALFDLQWKRMGEATDAWRKVHPGNDLVMPDLGTLLTWLVLRLAKAERLVTHIEDGKGYCEYCDSLAADFRDTEDAK